MHALSTCYIYRTAEPICEVAMSRPSCHILSIFIGGTKTLVDSRGEWQSSIARERVDGPVQLETGGFVGDQATHQRSSGTGMEQLFSYL